MGADLLFLIVDILWMGFALYYAVCLILQPYFSDAVRQTYSLSQDLLKPSEYDKLEKSLLSGLPNEVDFVVNVCTLLSNESRHVLTLKKSHQLVDLLLAHIGIFSEGKYFIMFD